MSVATPSPTSRPTIVLLHSSGASARQWDALAARLRPAFDVHAIDLQGHGAQPRWTSPRPLSVADEIALVLPAMQRAGGAHLIGHSYGAAVALHLAALRPELVQSLAVFEPVLFSLLAERERHGAATQQVFAVVEAMRQLVAGGEPERAGEHFVDYWSGAGAWQRLTSQQQRSVTSRMPLIVQHFDALFGEHLPPARLARLVMPVLCLSGDRSTPAALRVAQLLQGLLPRADHETLPGIGHLGPITHPELVNDRLLRFLLGTAATPAPRPTADVA